MNLLNYPKSIPIVFFLLTISSVMFPVNASATSERGLADVLANLTAAIDEASTVVHTIANEDIGAPADAQQAYLSGISRFHDSARSVKRYIELVREEESGKGLFVLRKELGNVAQNINEIALWAYLCDKQFLTGSKTHKSTSLEKINGVLSKVDIAIQLYDLEVLRLLSENDEPVCLQSFKCAKKFQSAP